MVARMTPYRIEVVIAPRALLRAQDGIDLLATGEAFSAALKDTAQRDVAELAEGSAELVLRVDATASAHTVSAEGPDEVTCRRLEREVRDLVWVVRECVPFAVLG